MLDTCCRMITELLCQGGQPSPRSLAKLLEKTHLGRSTVMSHLKHLETASLLSKEEIIQGRVGRPKILYKPTTRLLEITKTKSD